MVLFFFILQNTMEKNSFRRLFIFLACIPWAVIALPNIPKPVMDELKKQYGKPSFRETKDTFPLVKMISVLSSNEGHWKSLENVLDDDKLFIEMMRYIIFVETEKENKEYWNYVWDNASKIGVAAGTIMGGVAALKLLPKGFLTKFANLLMSKQSTAATPGIGSINKSICPHVVRNIKISTPTGFDLLPELLFSTICKL